MKKLAMKFAVGLGICLILSLIGYFMQPSITVIVQNESHNPLTDRVVIGGEIIAPQGQDGKIFRKKVWFGGGEVSLSGPFISTQVATYSVGPFQNKTLTLAPDSRDEDKILSEVLGGSEIKVTNLKIFRDQLAIVAFTQVDGLVNNDSFPSLFLYNKNSREWDEVSEEYILDRSSFQLDDKVKSYFGELTSD